MKTYFGVQKNLAKKLDTDPGRVHLMLTGKAPINAALLNVLFEEIARRNYGSNYLGEYERLKKAGWIYEKDSKKVEVKDDF